MLKIKDDVDLKELEKFGWEYETWDYVPMWTRFCGSGISLKVNTKNRKFILHQKTTGIWNKIDAIYDLIQAGLVEKIGE